MRYTSKQFLVDDIIFQHDRLRAELDSRAVADWEVAGVWGEDWSIKDLVLHLAEWQRMFIGWYESGLNCEKPVTPARGFKWNETPGLNRSTRERLRSESIEKALTDFESGFDRIMAILKGLTEEQLFSPGAFAWTGKYTLTTYLGANTASHYRFALKILARWRRRHLTKCVSDDYDQQ